MYFPDSSATYMWSQVGPKDCSSSLPDMKTRVLESNALDLQSRGSDGSGLSSRDVLSERIQNHTASIAVIGQGYVGFPLALEFARRGFPVTGLDTDPDRVAAITSVRHPLQTCPATI